MTEDTTELLLPRPESVIHAADLSARPSTLHGARLGLIWNSKPNGDALLDGFLHELGVLGIEPAAVDRYVKPGSAVRISDDVLERLTECDAVVVAVGDCGSCTSWAVEDALVLEDRGIPAVPIVSESFVLLARALATSKGRADLPFAVVEHPIGSLASDEAALRMRPVAESLVESLTRLPTSTEATSAVSWPTFAPPRPRADRTPPSAETRTTSLGRRTVASLDRDVATVSDFYYDHGYSDGLPVVPPTVPRVEEMLAGGRRAGSDELGAMPPSNAIATVADVAACAVMAGCQPEYFPVVLAAVEALLDPEFNLLGVQATTHSVAPMIMVNGPVAGELSINAEEGCFGPGWKANATIGRAIRLVLMNVGGAYPGLTDKATFGSPAKYGFVFAENEKDSPWDPWHVDHGFAADDSTVTAVGGEAPHNINDHGARTAEELMLTVARTMANPGNNNSYQGGTPVVVFGPEHALTIANDGWSKSDVQRYLFEFARVPWDSFHPTNIARFAHTRSNYFDPSRPVESVPLADRPEDFVIAVAGGVGKFSMFIPTFGLTRPVIKPIDRH